MVPVYQCTSAGAIRQAGRAPQLHRFRAVEVL